MSRNRPVRSFPFQAEWLLLAGRPLVMGLRWRAAGCAAAGLLLPLPLLLLMVLVGMPRLHAVAFYPPLCFFFLVGGVWTTLCRAVEHSAYSLRQVYLEVGVGLVVVLSKLFSKALEVHMVRA